MEPDPINTRTGSFIRQETDVEIPTRGLPLMLERTYSAVGIGDGPLGKGWTHNYNLRITNRNAAIVRVIAAHGSKLYFHREGTTYTPLPGVAATLTFDEVSQTYTLSNRAHVAYLFDSDGRPATVTDFLGYTTTYEYNLDGYLEKVIDPEGHTLMTNTMTISTA